MMFSGDINTNVLWIVTPDGQPRNGGEVTLNGDRARMEAAAGAGPVSIFITAEPHYAVDLPSRFVVLKELHRSSDLGNGVTYDYERDTLAGAKDASGSVHTEVNQAYTAVRLAERSGADTYAPEELLEARR